MPSQRADPHIQLEEVPRIVPDDDLPARLHEWASAHDNRVRAAVELLIEHDHWLWDEAFVKRCLFADGRLPAISFDAVLCFHDGDGDPVGSESQVAILRVIADIGSGRWGIDTMDIRNRERVSSAVTRAAGLTGL
jgi:hypothetical protein